MLQGALGLPNKQDVRDYAASQGLSEDEALKKGMEEKAVEFKQAGAQIYKEV